MKAVSLLSLVVVCVLYGCREREQGQSTPPGHTAPPPAVSALQQQVERHPDSAGLRLQLVDALDSAGLFTEAFRHLDTLIGRDSLNYGLWYRKGLLAQGSGDTSTAIVSFERAARIYQAPEVLLSLANLFAEKKDRRALQLSSLVQRMAPDRETEAHSFFIAGVYYARTGEDARALEMFNACVQHNYTYMEAYIEKGLVHFDNGDYAKALEVFRFASSINHLYADAYYYMARCHEMLKQKDSAILRFKQSLTLDKNLNEARQGLKRLGAD